MLNLRILLQVVIVFRKHPIRPRASPDPTVLFLPPKNPLPKFT